MLSRNARLNDFVRYPFLLYSIAGVYLFQHNKTQDVPHIFKNVSRIVMVVNFCSMFSTKISYCLFGSFENYKDVILFIAYWAFLLNSFAKLTTLWISRSTLEEAFDQLKDVYPNSKALRRSYRLDDYYKQNNSLQWSLSILHFGTLVLFNFMPLTQSLIEYYNMTWEERIFVHRFPYMLYYPFDETHPFLFMLCYVQQCFAAFSLSCLFVGSDLLMISMVHLLNMHFEYLAKRIVEYEPEGTDKDIEELEALVAYHNDILRSCDKIEATFSPSTILNFCASGFVICMMAVQIVAGAEYMILLKFLFFLISAQAHVYYICAYGSTLITLSTNISDAFCHQQWYMANIKYQKLLPLAVARAQKPAYLTAFKFFVVSMASFKTLMTTSYQFFTLLSSTLNE